MEDKYNKRRKLAILTIIFSLFIASESVSATTLSEIEERTTPVVRVVRRVASSVVNISTQQIVQRRVSPFGGFFDSFFKDFPAPEFIQRFKLKTLGSGIIFGNGRRVLTNQHVISGAQEISVITNKGKRLSAELVGADTITDIAVLRLRGHSSLPPIPLGTSSDLMIGETVIAIGNPFGLSNTVTVGVVSSLHRSLNGDGRVYKNLIQTDASINPGNSGGPLLTIVGKVVGINTAIYSKAQGIGFAIPIDKVKKIAGMLITYGSIPPVWIGIDCQILTPSIARHFNARGIQGILVTAIESGSPANFGHLKVGDIITGINQMPVTSPLTFQQILNQFLPGDTLHLSILRNGKKSTLLLKLKRLTPRHAIFLVRRLFGFGLRAPRRQERALLEKAGISSGVVISQVTPGSMAAVNGLRKGDILLQMNGVDLKDTETFRKVLIKRLRKGHFELLLLRGAYTYKLVFNLYSQS